MIIVESTILISDIGGDLIQKKLKEWGGVKAQMSCIVKIGLNSKL